MKAILNIELDAGVPGNTIDEKLHRVMQWTGRLFFFAMGRAVDASYDGPDGRVEASTAVVVVFTSKNKEALRQDIHNLSFDFAQDCIACVFDDGMGELIGPEQDRWGEFNPEYFRTEPAMEAAFGTDISHITNREVA